MTSTIDPLRSGDALPAGRRGPGEGAPRRAGGAAPRPARPPRAVLGRDPHHPAGARAAAGGRPAAAAAAGRHRPGLRRRHGHPGGRRCAPTSTRCRSSTRRTVPYASTVPGVCHACGHDVHTTAVLGAGLVLADLAARGQLPGRVRLIFQPAEESAAQRRAGRDRGRRGSRRWSGSSRCTATPAPTWARSGCAAGPITGSADQLLVRLHRAGRPHRPAAPDRRPGLRARQGGHRAAGRPVPPGRPAGRAERGLGPDRGRAGGQRHPGRGRGRGHRALPRRRPPGTTRPSWSRPGPRHRGAVRRAGGGRLRPATSPRWRTRRPASSMLAAAVRATEGPEARGGHRAEPRRRGLRLVPGGRPGRAGPARGQPAGGAAARALDLHQGRFDADERAISVGARVLVAATFVALALVLITAGCII